MPIYSDFWLTGAPLGPQWCDRADLPEREASGFPTPAELNRFANAPLHERQAIERAGYGYALSIVDSEDRHRGANQRYKERQRTARQTAPTKGATPQ